MREINVDTDVFAAIWAQRKPNENDENQILRRILLRASGGDENVKERLWVEKEGKSSKSVVKKSGEEEMGKVRWVDDIVAVLKKLGGRASLHSIYKHVEERRCEAGRSVPRTWEAVIRRTLEDHSSDSANFRGIDLFRLVDRGEWELR